MCPSLFSVVPKPTWPRNLFLGGTCKHIPAHRQPTNPVLGDANTCVADIGYRKCGSGPFDGDNKGPHGGNKGLTINEKGRKGKHSRKIWPREFAKPSRKGGTGSAEEVDWEVKNVSSFSNWRFGAVCEGGQAAFPLFSEAPGSYFHLLPFESARYP